MSALSETHHLGLFVPVIAVLVHIPTQPASRQKQAAIFLASAFLPPRRLVDQVESNVALRLFPSAGYGFLFLVSLSDDTSLGPTRWRTQNCQRLEEHANRLHRGDKLQAPSSRPTVHQRQCKTHEARRHSVTTLANCPVGNRSRLFAFLRAFFEMAVGSAHIHQSS